MTKTQPSPELIIFDVDGVLTDGKVYLTEKGDEIRAFHIHDGLGIKQLLKSGIEVAIISGRQSKAVDKRLSALGVKHIFQGVNDKLKVLKQLALALHVDLSQCIFVGDDLPDLPAMEAVGFAIAVNNAHADVQQAAHYVTTLAGGHGAVREICDKVIKQQLC